MALSVKLQEAFNKMAEIDDFISANGLENIPSDGLKRFKYTVIVIDEDGSTFSFRNAYALLYNRILMVFSEHNGNHVFSLDDLYGYDMFENVKLLEWGI